MTLNNDNNINGLRRHNDLKCVGTKQQSLKIHEAKTDRAERENRQLHNYHWGIQHDLSATDIINRQKINTDTEYLNNTTEAQ